MSDSEFLDHALDLLQEFGPVKFKKMMGGHCLFLDGLAFAIVADDTLYFKSDADNEALFADLGLPNFTYERQGKQVSMSYRQAPEAALEDAAEMGRWAAVGHEAAVRADRKKSKRAKPKRSTGRG